MAVYSPLFSAEIVFSRLLVGAIYKRIQAVQFGNSFKFRQNLEVAKPSASPKVAL
jgi:hypothetical protein